MKLKNLPLQIKILIAVVISLLLFSIVKSIYSGFVNMYNDNVAYTTEYTAVTNEQITTFDNDWLAFKEKTSIANISKDAFIQVTQIIFSGRSDGMNVAWKWAHENQAIPYEQFLIFYRELSEFSSMRFAKNNGLEIRKQQLVKNQNAMISVFPGVVFNYFLKIKPLVYKKGFVSKDTKVLFNE